MQTGVHDLYQHLLVAFWICVSNRVFINAYVAPSYCSEGKVKQLLKTIFKLLNATC